MAQFAEVEALLIERNREVEPLARNMGGLLRGLFEGIDRIIDMAKAQSIAGLSKIEAPECEAARVSCLRLRTIAYAVVAPRRIMFDPEQELYAARIYVFQGWNPAAQPLLTVTVSHDSPRALYLFDAVDARGMRPDMGPKMPTGGRASIHTGLGQEVAEGIMWYLLAYRPKWEEGVRLGELVE